MYSKLSSEIAEKYLWMLIRNDSISSGYEGSAVSFGDLMKEWRNGIKKILHEESKEMMDLVIEFFNRDDLKVLEDQFISDFFRSKYPQYESPRERYFDIVNKIEDITCHMQALKLDDFIEDRFQQIYRENSDIKKLMEKVGEKNVQLILKLAHNGCI